MFAVPGTVVAVASDTGHKGLMPGVTPRLTGHTRVVVNPSKRTTFQGAASQPPQRAPRAPAYGGLSIYYTVRYKR